MIRKFFCLVVPLLLVACGRSPLYSDTLYIKEADVVSGQAFKFKYKYIVSDSVGDTFEILSNTSYPIGTKIQISEVQP